MSVNTSVLKVNTCRTIGSYNYLQLRTRSSTRQDPRNRYSLRICPYLVIPSVRTGPYLHAPDKAIGPTQEVAAKFRQTIRRSVIQAHNEQRLIDDVEARSVTSVL